MKKRILSLVLCAVMLLSMCLFMGAGVTQDAAEAAGEVPQATPAANNPAQSEEKPAEGSHKD